MNPPLSDQAIPLFPLGTVLFPDGLLPLRIFEVRYLDMIKRCHRAGSEFGVVSLIQGAEVTRAGDAAPERFHAIGTRAAITRFAQPQPGLYEIVTRGTTRFRVVGSTRTATGLWMADVEDIPPDPPCEVPPELSYVTGNLLQLLDMLKASDVSPVHEPKRFEDGGWVANRWCELLPLQPDDRQRLMEMRDPLLRLELVGDVLDRTDFGQT
ncbi:LON peptidase substrate-binding domain-containing protein [Methyloversatilis sp.]|uniref:LON peptidase substrate-binding domain-containing protein n=1 Tax=Methyloversatilis sp. TaxID=2569862 RepID=UPI0035B22F17